MLPMLLFNRRLIHSWNRQTELHYIKNKHDTHTHTHSFHISSVVGCRLSVFRVCEFVYLVITKLKFTQTNQRNRSEIWKCMHLCWSAFVLLWWELYLVFSPMGYLYSHRCCLNSNRKYRRTNRKHHEKFKITDRILDRHSHRRSTLIERNLFSQHKSILF